MARKTHHHDWRCSGCFKLLGRQSETQIHVRFARGHHYTFARPVTAICRSCGTLNSLPR
ncbi:hypothetical protein [Oceanicola sp. 22II-s10i]|uniref:hypothetical protein n=1 Tax=Oceanicola sp. 22II-s10i TaxID=1317116 RepID=UPI001595F118|nr:hypothetical protein [Oceanicola sp. 22II-s10i]